MQVDDVNSMFANIDELRKNGWMQIQPPADEVNLSVIDITSTVAVKR